MQVGTTIRPCGIISGVLLLMKAARTESEFDIISARSVIVLSILLLLLGWIKGVQVMKYTNDLYTHLKEKNHN